MLTFEAERTNPQLPRTPHRPSTSSRNLARASTQHHHSLHGRRPSLFPLDDQYAMVGTGKRRRSLDWSRSGPSTNSQPPFLFSGCTARKCVPGAPVSPGRRRNCVVDERQLICRPTGERRAGKAFSCGRNRVDCHIPRVASASSRFENGQVSVLFTLESTRVQRKALAPTHWRVAGPPSSASIHP